LFTVINKEFFVYNSKQLTFGSENGKKLRNTGKNAAKLLMMTVAYCYNPRKVICLENAEKCRKIMMIVAYCYKQKKTYLVW
jgi:hypothetical protein